MYRRLTFILTGSLVVVCHHQPLHTTAAMLPPPPPAAATAASPQGTAPPPQTGYHHDPHATLARLNSSKGQLKTIRNKFEAAQRAGKIPDTRTSSANPSPIGSKGTSPEGSFEALNTPNRPPIAPHNGHPPPLRRPGSVGLFSVPLPANEQPAAPASPRRSSVDNGPPRRQSVDNGPPRRQSINNGRTTPLSPRKNLSPTDNGTADLQNQLSEAHLHVQAMMRQQDNTTNESKEAILAQQKHKEEYEAKVEELNRKIKELMAAEDQKQELENKNRELQSELDRKDEEFNSQKEAVVTRLIEHFKEQMDEAFSARDTAEAELIEVKNNSTALSAELHAANDTVTRLNAEIEAWRTKPPDESLVKSFEEQKTQYESKIKELEFALVKKDEDFAAEKQVTVERIIEHLKEQADASIQEFEAERDEAQNNVVALTSELDTAKSTITELRAELDTAKSTITELNDQLGTLTQRVEEQTTKISEIQSEIDRKDEDHANDKHETLSNIISHLKIHMDEASEAVVTAHNERDAERVRADELQSQLDTLNEIKAALEASLATEKERAATSAQNTEAELEAMRTERATFDASLASYIASLDAANEQIAQLTSALKDSHTERNAANARADELHAVKTTLEQELAAETERADSMQAYLTEANSLRAELAAEREAANGRISELESVLQAAQNERDDANARAEKSQQDLDHLHAEKASLEASLAQGTDRDNIAESLSAELETLRAEKANIDAHLADRLAELQSANEYISQLNDALFQAENERTADKDRIYHMSGELDRLYEVKASLETSLAEEAERAAAAEAYCGETDALRAEKQDWDASLAEQAADLDTANGHIVHLNGELGRMRSMLDSYANGAHDGSAGGHPAPPSQHGGMPNGTSNYAPPPVNGDTHTSDSHLAQRVHQLEAEISELRGLMAETDAVLEHHETTTESTKREYQSYIAQLESEVAYLRSSNCTNSHHDGLNTTGTSFSCIDEDEHVFLKLENRRLMDIVEKQAATFEEERGLLVTLCEEVAMKPFDEITL